MVNHLEDMPFVILRRGQNSWVEEQERGKLNMTSASRIRPGVWGGGNNHNHSNYYSCYFCFLGWHRGLR
jgi:hypothetical protein